MESGLGIPTREPLAGRDGIDAIATRAEALGFSRLAVSDHPPPDRAVRDRFPPSPACSGSLTR